MSASLAAIQQRQQQQQSPPIAPPSGSDVMDSLLGLGDDEASAAQFAFANVGTSRIGEGEGRMRQRQCQGEEDTYEEEGDGVDGPRPRKQQKQEEEFVAVVHPSIAQLEDVFGPHTPADDFCFFSKIDQTYPEKLSDEVNALLTFIMSERKKKGGNTVELVQMIKDKFEKTIRGPSNLARQRAIARRLEKNREKDLFGSEDDQQDHEEEDESDQQHKEPEEGEEEEKEIKEWTLWSIFNYITRVDTSSEAQLENGISMLSRMLATMEDQGLYVTPKENCDETGKVKDSKKVTAKPQAWAMCVAALRTHLSYIKARSELVTPDASSSSSIRGTAGSSGSGKKGASTTASGRALVLPPKTGSSISALNSKKPPNQSDLFL